MADHTGASVSPESASSNLYWTFGEKEIFNIQTTVRGDITDDQVSAHLASVKAMMKAIVKSGGHAKQVGGGAAQSNGASSTATPTAGGFEFYKGKKGKKFIKIPPGVAEPNEITCPDHGEKMKRKTNDDGAWYSHRNGESWCSIAVPGNND